MQTKNNNEYNSLFNDIEDSILRAHNRAVVLANLFDEHTRDNTTSPRGIELMTGYMNNIPQVDRFETYAQFQEQMQLRGYEFHAETVH